MEIIWLLKILKLVSFPLKTRAETALHVRLRRSATQTRGITGTGPVLPSSVFIAKLLSDL
jgi:hypothetical protein